VTTATVAYNDRVLCVGRNGSGKSELLNVLFAGLRCQRVLVDPKDEWTVRDADGEPVAPVSRPEAIDWTQRTIHVVPRRWSPGTEWEQLFAAAFERRHLTLAIHEAAYSCDFRPGLVGPEHNTYISQGRAHGLGYWGATQRPVCLPTYATSEPGHVFAFAEKMKRDDDHRTLAQMLDTAPAELADAQRELLADFDSRHGFLYFDSASGQLSAWPPLPAELRKQTCVTRRSVA
jgi:energy-coupling factor transporter ATP-binding protein EcfA2